MRNKFFILYIKQIVGNMRMHEQYIGSCFDCRLICLENNDKAFEKSHKGRHKDFQRSSYLAENKRFINKNKSDWEETSEQLKKFFKAVYDAIDTIRSEAVQKLETSRISEAINSDIPEHIVIAKKVIKDEYEHLKCQDIAQFEELKSKRRMHQTEERDDILNQTLKKAENILNKRMNQFVQEYKMSSTKTKRQRSSSQKSSFSEKNFRNRRGNQRGNRKPQNRNKNRNETGPRTKRKVSNFHDSDEKKEEPSDHRRGGNERTKKKNNEKQITFLKDLPKEDGGNFNVQIKVKQILRTIKSKNGPKIMFLAEDQTGTERVVTHVSKAIVAGVRFRITNCSIYVHHGERQISTKRQTRLIELNRSPSSGGQESEKQQIDFDIDEKKIADIEPGDQNIGLVVKIMEIKGTIGVNLDCIIGDQTAISKALLPSKYEFIKESEVVRLENLDAEVVKERIVIQANKNSKIYPRKKNFPLINTNKNISDALWVEE